MKIGSLVELVDTNFATRRHKITYPIKGVVYTVRFIEKLPYGTGITLEEIVNPKVQTSDGFGECIFNINKFRELQPPIENIEEHINLNSLEYENK
jgi:hypothetical protein